MRSENEEEEEVDIDKVIAWIRAALRIGIKISKAVDAKVDMTLFPDKEEGKTTCGWLMIGDYEFWFDESTDTFRLDYQPVGHSDKWELRLDQKRLVSFTMPPKPSDKDRPDSGPEEA